MKNISNYLFFRDSEVNIIIIRVRAGMNNTIHVKI